MTKVAYTRVMGYEDSASIARFMSFLLDMYRVEFETLRRLNRPPLVVIRPNWIREAHETKPDEWEQVTTHPVVLQALLERLADVLNNGGTIVLCDAPHTYADFDGIVSRGGLREWLHECAARHPNLQIELLDLRREIWWRKEQVVVERVPNKPAPRGYRITPRGVRKQEAMNSQTRRRA